VKQSMIAFNSVMN